MVNKMIVKPLRISNRPFIRKSQPFRNRSAPLIFYRTADFDTIHPLLNQQIVNARLACFRHQSHSLKRFAKPVANARFSIHSINIMNSNDTGQLATMPNPCLKTIASSKFPQSLTDLLGHTKKTAPKGYPNCLLEQSCVSVTIPAKRRSNK